MITTLIGRGYSFSYGYWAGGFFPPVFRFVLVLLLYTVWLLFLLLLSGKKTGLGIIICSGICIFLHVINSAGLVRFDLINFILNLFATAAFYSAMIIFARVYTRSGYQTVSQSTPSAYGPQAFAGGAFYTNPGPYQPAAGAMPFAPYQAPPQSAGPPPYPSQYAAAGPYQPAPGMPPASAYRPPQPAWQPNPTPASQAPAPSASDALKQITDWRRDDLITDEEFEKKKKEIIDRV